MIDRTETIVEHRTVRFDVDRDAPEPLYAVLTEDAVEVTFESVANYSALTLPREVFPSLLALLTAVAAEVPAVEPVPEDEELDDSEDTADDAAPTETETA